LNTNEHARQHAEHARQVTQRWHRLAADSTLEAQQRARATEAQAKSEALQRSTDYNRAAHPLAHYENLRPGDAA